MGAAMSSTAAVLLFGFTAAALAVLGFVSALRALRPSGDPILRRLRPRPPAAAPEPVASSSGSGSAGKMLSALGAVGGSDPDEAKRTRQLLIQAGLRGESAPRILAGAKVLFALCLPLSFLWINSGLEHPLRLGIPISVWLCTMGYFAPSFWVSMRARQRRALIERGLPDALDLMVTCVEAGLGLDAAIQRVCADLKLSWPALSEELNLTSLELKAGITRTDAFRRLHGRTGVDELKTLAATLAQAEMFGTSIAVSLRLQASGMRVRRMHRAEERAAVVSVKMTIPLVLCILPSLIAIVIGPAAVNIAHSLSRLGGGH